MKLLQLKTNFDHKEVWINIEKIVAIHEKYDGGKYTGTTTIDCGNHGIYCVDEEIKDVILKIKQRKAKN